MNWVRTSLILLLCLGMSQSGALENTTEGTLDNGLKVIVRTDQRAPVATVQVWDKVGSAYEHNGSTGISHMLEHMMFKGSEHVADEEHFKIVSESRSRNVANIIIYFVGVINRTI